MKSLRYPRRSSAGEARPDRKKAQSDIASTALSLWTRALIDAHFSGTARQTFLHHHGLDGIEAGDTRMPYIGAIEVWRALTDTNADPLFGLNFASQLKPGQLGVVGYLAAASATLGEALDRVVRFHRLLKDPAQTALLHGRLGATVIDVPRAGFAAWPRHLAEATIAAYLVLSTQLTGKKISPRKIRFQHLAPAQAAAVEGFFGCPVQFGQSVNSIELPPSALRFALNQADPQLAQYLEEVARAQLTPLEANDGALLRSVRQWILAELSNGPPTLTGAARHVARTPRTLQRALAARGQSFGQLVDEVRHASATKLLADPAVTRSEVAYLLGYSDAGGLRRALARWRLE